MRLDDFSDEAQCLNLDNRIDTLIIINYKNYLNLYTRFNYGYFDIDYFGIGLKIFWSRKFHQDEIILD